MSLLKSKRGQAGGAGALIGIITLLFIFYILFLPPEERRELLEENGTGTTKFSGDILLSESVGRLAFSDKRTFDHDIPSMFLEELRSAELLHSENPFVVKKGWFGDQEHSLRFLIPKLDATDNVLLSFQTPVHSGYLRVRLNGNIIYESQINTQNPGPIRLPKELLASTNTIHFSVDGHWLSRRRFEFIDVKVLGEVLDARRQVGEDTFTLSETEHENLDDAYLQFFPVCEQERAGTLTISLNGKIVYSAPPACEGLNRQDLFVDDLREGRNTVRFAIDEGSYRLEQIRVRTFLKELDSFIDYFEIEEDLWEEIEDDDEEVELRIEFIDNDKRHKAELNINGHKDVIDQTDETYEEEITRWVKEGNNYIEIKPLTDLDIVLVEVRVT